MNEKISEVQIVPIKPKDGLVGFVSFIYDNAFYMGSIGLFTRPQGGYRLTFPLRKNTEKDINYFYPINKAIALELEKAVIDKYEKLIGLN